MSPRSPSDCSTIAVEDIARIKPTASEDFHGRPIQSATRPTATAVPNTCNPPSPENRPPHLPQQRGTQLEPDHEQHHHHAELGEVHHIASAIDEAQRVRSDDGSRQQVTNHRPEPEPFRQRHRDDRRQQIDKRLIKSAAHCLSNYKLAKQPP
jgi:hypothetical protein